MDVVDLNHGSGYVYGIGACEISVTQRVNTLIDAALLMARREQPERDYLGASRLGEPCCRRLAYEITHTPPDDGHAIREGGAVGHHASTGDARHVMKTDQSERSHRTSHETSWVRDGPCCCTRRQG